VGDEKMRDADQINKELAECEARLKKFRAEPGEAPDDIDGIEDELNYCKVQLQEAKDKSAEAWADAKHTIVTRLDRLKRRLHSRTNRQTGGIQ
jgi:chromosome segregation ATPase